MSDQKNTRHPRKLSALNPLAPGFPHAPSDARRRISDSGAQRPYMPMAAAPTKLQISTRGYTIPMHHSGIQQPSSRSIVSSPDFPLSVGAITPSPVQQLYMPVRIAPTAQRSEIRTYAIPRHDNDMHSLSQPIPTGPRSHEQHRRQKRSPHLLSREIMNLEVQPEYQKHRGKPGFPPTFSLIFVEMFLR